MKMFSQFKLTKELVLLFTFGIIILLYFAFPDYYYRTLHVQAQLQQQHPLPMMTINITSPMRGEVPVGELTISGTSTDNATTDCTVYADWNNTKPFQKAVATGPGGVNDYSSWTFTYTAEYHLITNGTNNLTSTLSCLGDDSNVGTANITKSYNIKVIGVTESSESNTSGGARGDTSESTIGGTSGGTIGGTSGGTTGNTSESTIGGTSGGARGDTSGGTIGGTSGGARGDTIESPYGNPSRGTTGSITGISEGTSGGARGDTSESTIGDTSGGARGDTSEGTIGDTSGGARGDTIESPRGNPSRGTTGSITGSQ